ncbi:hypothetical protein BQ8482_500007 [Mesorhizobium delmotii]|uniref:Uncharacterized protein n=1 Tax=Mesorhizobium delmotii TaxID=1631247 RepID=A0A2P9AUI6_9HYPH|nr:hypothetical protein BQ8482_500007 [Mesorhizobium delmotii]
MSLMAELARLRHIGIDRTGRNEAANEPSKDFALADGPYREKAMSCGLNAALHLATPGVHLRAGDRIPPAVGHEIQTCSMF